MRKTLVLVALILGVLLSACGSPATPTAQPTTAATVPPAGTTEPAAPQQPQATQEPTLYYGILPDVNPLEVEGDIITAGSSTVYPLSEAIAVRFRDEGYQGNITVDSIGSGAGFERFCKSGETDIANASRPIKSSEVESCRAIGREPIGFRVGTDGLAVVVSKDNTFLTDVTMEQLAAIFSSGVEKWSDVNPEWPDQPILRYSPGTDSGTFDFFVEEVLGKNKALLLEAKNTQFSEDDNVLVQGVEGSPYAIGYFGYAYYQENRGKLRALKINGVEPNEQTVESGEYPLARPLFLYSAPSVLKEKPQVAAFIAYYLIHVNEEISAVGYFPASEATLKESAQALMDALK